MFYVDFNLIERMPKHIAETDNPIKGIGLAILATFPFLTYGA